MKRVRAENNFQDLVKNKKIVIPIIQRDYAQGRNNHKAIVVRSRLIDEWIDILRNESLRMDFNYIYGNEDGNVFYPVDGQQRLTSLYLLHWYLAQATENIEEIYDWQFDYKTRNSASEFFAFLREPNKSKDLFCILSADTNEELIQNSIRNESWFKTKWGNDPTVVSCVNFLCMLAIKLKKYESQFVSFRERLKDTSSPAVYFTCLNECDDKYAEIDAAKKYTRMNARGKRLTNFENLKAMIDEIEMKYIKELQYCCAEDLEKETDTISWAYDRVYIDCLYNNLQKNSLLEKTKAINDESENWFRLIYYVYALVNERIIPSDLSPNGYDTKNESYEDVIYKISQARVEDDEIVKYLYMIKAVFEVLCNSGEKLAYKYNHFTFSNMLQRRKAIAFILFVSRLWDRNNKNADNLCLINKWVQFDNMMEDMCFEDWQVKGDQDVATIVLNMLDSIANTPSKSVDEYYISNDFQLNNPFINGCILPDIKCRIIERKIKAKLVSDRAVNEERLNQVCNAKFRLGYLYYICGFLDDWKVDDWSQKETWSGEVINEYINFLSIYNKVEQLMNSREAKVVFAYSSQYDEKNERLSLATEIDRCNNEHIWNDSFLLWQDDEYNSLEDKKKKQMDHFKVMVDLLLEYRKSSGISYDKLIDEYTDVITSFFDSSSVINFHHLHPVGTTIILPKKVQVLK